MTTVSASLVVALGLAGCGSSAMSIAGKPSANPARDIIDTQLSIDVSANTGTATITFSPSDTPGANLDVGDLSITSVMVDGHALDSTRHGAQLELALPVSKTPLAVSIAYAFQRHDRAGESKTGYTLTWPYWCGNLFPCHPEPEDGSTFGLELRGVPAGQVAVYPTKIAVPVPAYQLAWAIGAYTELSIGTTPAGTRISVFDLPGEDAKAMAGAAHLVAAFAWLETTLGPYRFGKAYASVSVAWGSGALGGMEHHPYSHVASSGIGDEESHVHEAAHGWFGDGVRIGCWEDFVLSEGTVSYLAARALEVVAPAVGAAVWTRYEQQLAQLSGRELVSPRSCGSVDILRDHLFSLAPYMRGAFFYRGVADKVGADVLDRALRTFYQAHAGGSATMAEMLASIREVTGYDPTACAEIWLSSRTRPTPGPCP